MLLTLPGPSPALKRGHPQNVLVLEMLQAQEKDSCPSSEFVEFHDIFVLEMLQAKEKVSCPSSEFVKFYVFFCLGDIASSGKG